MQLRNCNWMKIVSIKEKIAMGGRKQKEQNTSAIVEIAKRSIEPTLLLTTYHESDSIFIIKFYLFHFIL